MEGVLSEGRVPEILRELCVNRRSGHLHFQRGTDRRTVVFKKGSIVSGAADAPGRRFGDTMVCDGLLTADELERVRAAVARTRRPFGAVLEDLGLIERDRFEDELALYVREILLEVLGWEDGSFRFQECEVEVEAHGNATLRLSTGEVILEAVRLVSSRRALRRMLGDLDRVLVVSTDPLLRFQRISLTPTDGYILSRIDGTATTRQIIEIAPLPAEDVERSLVGLICTGLVELAPPAPPRDAEEKRTFGDEPPEGRSDEAGSELRRHVLEVFAHMNTRNHFEMLGVPVTASPQEVRTAYFRLERLYHPDGQQHDPALAGLHGQFEQIVARINEAYDVLSHPDSRARYESLVAPRQAATLPPGPGWPGGEPDHDPTEASAQPPAAGPEQPAESPDQALTDAEHLFAEQRYWEMIGLIQGVMPRARGRTRLRLHTLQGRAYLLYPDNRKQAIEEFEAVLAEDPGDAQVHFLLGTAFRDEGLTKRALGHFRKALELRPYLKEAQAELLKLEKATGG